MDLNVLSNLTDSFVSDLKLNSPDFEFNSAVFFLLTILIILILIIVVIITAIVILKIHKKNNNHNNYNAQGDYGNHYGNITHNRDYNNFHSSYNSHQHGCGDQNCSNQPIMPYHDFENRLPDFENGDYVDLNDTDFNKPSEEPQYEPVNPNEDHGDSNLNYLDQENNPDYANDLNENYETQQGEDLSSFAKAKE